MEKNSYKTKKTMLMLAIGFYIIYMFVGASTPGMNYYLLAGPLVGVSVSLLTFSGWVLIYNALRRIEMSYSETLFGAAKIISVIGMGLYIIYLIIVILGYAFPDSGLSAYVKGAHLSYYAVESHVWIHRSIMFMLVAVYISRTLIGIIVVMAFHRALLNSYKNINRISLVNELVCVLVVVLQAVPILILDSLEELLLLGQILHMILRIAFCLYIYSLNKRVKIYRDYSNGSVFNRIPEEEYQDFLSKMNK